MQVELLVPAVGESITEVEIGAWLKAEGDPVAKDDNLVTLETEKATIELPAPVSGVLGKISKAKGATAKVGEVIAYIQEGVTKKDSAPVEKPAAPAPDQPATSASPKTSDEAAARATPAGGAIVMPAAARVISEHGLQASEISGTGPGGRILKEDAERRAQAKPADKSSAPRPASAPQPGRNEEVVPMTRLRRTVAARLVEAQQTAALLTTFNEIDMGSVMALRKEFQDSFTTKYGVKLGFMSFFVKAAVDALKSIPQINAEIRGNDIIYRNYFDIGVAIGGGKGLVVPVIKNAERLSFAEIEIAIQELARRAKENKLTPDELSGGTFTITNGGIYGSLLSTPIVNPPQSGILGMHAIQDRPVAREGSVVIRPMMYVALTYDHRVVDGKEAVTFLKRIKEVIENPTRMLLEV